MLMLSEIAKAVGGRMQGADVLCESVGSDSRHILKNQLFVGIKGERFDGSMYAQEAIKQGAVAALVADANTQASPVIVVSDTRLALGQLAKYWRNKFKISLIAVTGSNGKTTVKEMIAAILAATNSNILATKGNLNNDIGMPMTLLKMRKEHAYAVIEMGMSHEGEIRYLTDIAQPTVAVVNNAGIAHIGEVGSREGIARAKGEIFEGLSEDGIAIINADDDFADYWKSLNAKRKVVTFGLNKKADISAAYQVNGNLILVHLTTPNGQIKFDLHVLGIHNINNALAASAVAAALGVSNQDIAKGLTSFGAVKGRLNWLAGFNESVVIDDTYNANPDSMKAALDVLANQKSTQIFVMGDMAELGQDTAKMHADIGAYAKQKNINQLFTFGELSSQATTAFGKNAEHFTDLETLIARLKPLMHKGVTLLVKGSRFMQMERVVKELIVKETNNQLEAKPCC
jgi:UDP-N-acetylmuramoyl-tripeptide--D-alanyl-D-alanine ligase